MEAKKIYLAEDEENIRNLLETFLQQEGYDVTTFETGDDLYNQFIKVSADLIILDVMMPGSSGFTVCNKLRDISTVPIIFLTARDSDEDFISGITLGSDAYFTKPFSPVKLMVQIKAMLRREAMVRANVTSGELVEAKFIFGDLTVDTKKLMVYAKEQLVNLTATEFSFLQYLIQHSDRAISRDELLSKVWGYDAIVETRATDDTVKRLRKKLLEVGSDVAIETVRGFGFTLEVGGTADEE